MQSFSGSLSTCPIFWQGPRRASASSTGLVRRVRALYSLAAAFLTAGRTDALFYDVYSKLAELHLAQVGLDIAWSEVRVSAGDEEDRWGATRKYFTVPWYRLPVCRMGVME
jgi:hypothetical protein